MRAIELANKLSSKLGLESLIVARGGGSLEDLQAFNEESVARAISNSELPITSAVGHEIDYTIADFVADLRAPTPSAAAEVLSTDQDDYYEYLHNIIASLNNQIEDRIDFVKQQLDMLTSRLKSPGKKLQEHAQDLDRLESQILLLIKNQINKKQSEINFFKQSILGKSPQNKINWDLSKLETSRKILIKALNNYLDRNKSALASLSRSLEGVSPLSTLDRGYSICLLYTSPSPRDKRQSRMPSSA